MANDVSKANGVFRHKASIGLLSYAVVRINMDLGRGYTAISFVTV